MPPNKAKMDAFLAFMKNEIENPPKASELFIIPSDKPLPPAWSTFFDKIMKHMESQCQDRHQMQRLEKRKWLMEDGKLSEFEMMMSASNMKTKVGFANARLVLQGF